jgi:hypothetical protein
MTACSLRTRVDSAMSVVPRNVAQTTPGMKPVGLWYEVDGDWQRWCAGEMPQWLAGRHLHRVKLDGEQIIALSSASGIDAFNAQYCSIGPCGIDFIDWPRVAEEYDGIEIAPYCWRRRLTPGMLWYYGWDCASGCIWRPRGMRLSYIARLDGSVEDGIFRSRG